MTALAMPVLAHRSGATPALDRALGRPDDRRPGPGGRGPGRAARRRRGCGPALLGLGMGGNLSLALTVVHRLAPTPAAAPAYSGMAFFVGYLLAALGPVAAGALRDATGGFTAVFATLAVLGVITLVVGLASARVAPAASTPQDRPT